MEKFGLNKLKGEAGATAVEYIIIALIIVLIIAFVFGVLLRGSITEAGRKVGDCITSGGSNC